MMTNIRRPGAEIVAHTEYRKYVHVSHCLCTTAEAEMRCGAECVCVCVCGEIMFTLLVHFIDAQFTRYSIRV